MLLRRIALPAAGLYPLATFGWGILAFAAGGAAEASAFVAAYLASVVLANSEFRHELESQIDPFKGLLLGLFFIAVGMDIACLLQRDAFPTRWLPALH